MLLLPPFMASSISVFIPSSSHAAQGRARPSLPGFAGFALLVGKGCVRPCRDGGRVPYITSQRASMTEGKMPRAPNFMAAATGEEGGWGKLLEETGATTDPVSTEKRASRSTLPRPPASVKLFDTGVST